MEGSQEVILYIQSIVQDLHPQLCEIFLYLRLKAHPGEDLLKLRFNKFLWHIRTQNQREVASGCFM